MASGYYALQTDNLMGVSSPLSSSGAAIDSAFPLGNLKDLKPWSPCKATASGALRFIGDMGSSRTVYFVLIPVSNIAVATVVTFEMNAINSWPGTSSTTITVPAFDANGFRACLFKELPSPITNRWWSVSIASFGTACAVGEIFIGGAKRTDIQDFRLGMRDPQQLAHKVRRTDGGVKLAYRLPVENRAWAGQIVCHDAAQLAALRTLHRSVGQTYTTAAAVVLDATAATPDARLVTFDSDMLDAYQVEGDVWAADVTLEEVSRGATL